MARRRLVAALIFGASLVLVGIPLAWLWLLSQLDLAYTEIYLLALLGCPAVVIGWGAVLLRLNGLYLEASEQRAGSVLDVSISVAVLIALATFAIWLVIGASGPGPRVYI
jgi:hypothetical protein